MIDNFDNLIDKVVLEKKIESVYSPQIPHNKQSTPTISKMVFGMNPINTSNLSMKEQKRMKSQIKRMNDYITYDGEKWFEMVKTLVEIQEEEGSVDSKSFFQAMLQGHLGVDVWLYHKTLQDMEEELKEKVRQKPELLEEGSK